VISESNLIRVVPGLRVPAAEPCAGARIQ
jgi:hypothetical protein